MSSYVNELAGSIRFPATPLPSFIEDHQLRVTFHWTSLVLFHWVSYHWVSYAYPFTIGVNKLVASKLQTRIYVIFLAYFCIYFV